MSVVTRSQSKAQKRRELELELEREREQQVSPQVSIEDSMTEFYFDNAMKRIQQCLNMCDNLEKLKRQNAENIKKATDSNKIRELKIKQRQLRFKKLEEVIELLYVTVVGLDDLHNTKYQSFVDKFGRSTLATIRRLYEEIETYWDERFSPCSSYESSIMQILLESFQSTENKLIGYFPDEERTVFNIDQLLFLP